MKNTLLFIVYIILTGFSLQGQSRFSFLFLSDVHLQPENRATEGFEAAIKKANTMEHAFVITGGDLIMDALNVKESRADSLFLLYAMMQKDFDKPVYNTPGNHDVFGWNKSSGIPENHPQYGIKKYEYYIEKPFYSFMHDGWKFFILNSIAHNDSNTYYGEISSQQMAWIEDELETMADTTPVILVTHIPFFTTYSQYFGDVMEPNTRGLVVENANEVISLFTNHNLRLVLQGHLHIYESIMIDGITFITGGAVSGKWWKGPNRGTEEGFLKIDINGNSFQYNYIDYGWQTEEDPVF